MRCGILSATRHAGKFWPTSPKSIHSVNTTTLEGVHLTLFSAKHGTVQVTARRGVIQNESKNMQVCGDVRLVMGDEFALTTECLQWFAVRTVAGGGHAGDCGDGQPFTLRGRASEGGSLRNVSKSSEQVLARWSEP